MNACFVIMNDLIKNKIKKKKKKKKKKKRSPTSPIWLSRTEWDLWREQKSIQGRIQDFQIEGAQLKIVCKQRTSQSRSTSGSRCGRGPTRAPLKLQGFRCSLIWYLNLILKEFFFFFFFYRKLNINKIIDQNFRGGARLLSPAWIRHCYSHVHMRKLSRFFTFFQDQEWATWSQALLDMCQENQDRQTKHARSNMGISSIKRHMFDFQTKFFKRYFQWRLALRLAHLPPSNCVVGREDSTSVTSQTLFPRVSRATEIWQALWRLIPRHDTCRR